MKKQAILTYMTSRNPVSTSVLKAAANSLRAAGFVAPFKLRIGQLEAPVSPFYDIEGNYPANITLVNVSPNIFTGTIAIDHPNPGLQDEITIESDDGNPEFDMRGIFQNVAVGQTLPEIRGTATIYQDSNNGIRIGFADTATGRITFDLALPDETAMAIIDPTQDKDDIEQILVE